MAEHAECLELLQQLGQKAEQLAGASLGAMGEAQLAAAVNQAEAEAAQAIQIKQELDVKLKALEEEGGRLANLKKPTKAQKKKTVMIQQQYNRLYEAQIEQVAQLDYLKQKIVRLKQMQNSSASQQFRLQLKEVYEQQLANLEGMRDAMEYEMQQMELVLPEHQQELKNVKDEIERLKRDMDRVQRGESIDDMYEEDGVTLKKKSKKELAKEKEQDINEKFNSEQELNLGLVLDDAVACPPRLKEFMSP
ncbi:unnamed protein product, partial [Amoebophrya sp. A120]|eukprot:GSA120T00010301001.1